MAPEVREQCEDFSFEPSKKDTSSGSNCLNKFVSLNQVSTESQELKEQLFDLLDSDAEEEISIVADRSHYLSQPRGALLQFNFRKSTIGQFDKEAISELPEVRKIRSLDICEEEESLWDEDTEESTNGSEEGIPVICEY